MASKSEATQKETKQALDALLGQIHRVLSEGDKVFIPQFGTFELRYHLAKQGRNPQTGETIEIDGYNQPSFKFSANVKKIIN